MKRRIQLWNTLAAEFPRSYWVTQSLLFYGSFTLTNDIANALGWAAAPDWPVKVLAATVFGGIMLGMAQRRLASVTPAP